MILEKKPKNFQEKIKVICKCSGILVSPSGSVRLDKNFDVVCWECKTAYSSSEIHASIREGFTVTYLGIGSLDG